jgi:hypothetical protein
MTKPTPEFLVRPLFYDALSGEFQPPHDPEHAHTLGRLAFGAFSKGVRFLNRDLGTPYIAEYTYAPVWAPTVIAKIDCETAPRSTQTLLLQGIHLRDAANRRLSIENYMMGSDHLLQIGTRHVNESFPLVLGAPLNTARDTIARSAQEFFDQAAQ